MRYVCGLEEEGVGFTNLRFCHISHATDRGCVGWQGEAGAFAGWIEEQWVVDQFLSCYRFESAVAFAVCVCVCVCVCVLSLIHI